MVWLLTLLLTGVTSGVTPATPKPATADVPTMRASAHAPTVEAMLEADSRRIRTGNARVNKLLFDGVRRSRTFADLVARVHATDVIVYIEPTWSLPPEMAGRILLQVVAGNQRYLRMQIKTTLHGDQIIAVIAHELRHALEVAEARGVVDDSGMLELYRRIGHASNGLHAFDTTAAIIAGRVVAEELIG